MLAVIIVPWKKDIKIKPAESSVFPFFLVGWKTDRPQTEMISVSRQVRPPNHPSETATTAQNQLRFQVVSVWFWVVYAHLYYTELEARDT